MSKTKSFVLVSISAKRPSPASVKKAKDVLKASEKAKIQENKAKIKEMIAQTKIIYAERDDKLKELESEIKANLKALEAADRSARKLQAKASSLELKKNSIYDQYEKKARKYWDQIKKIENEDGTDRPDRPSITLAMQERGKKVQRKVVRRAVDSITPKSGRGRTN